MNIGARRAAVDPDVHLPGGPVRPLRSIGLRVGFSVFALVLTVVLVYVDRDGYKDATTGQMSFVDCLYYATVTLSTTGYGDIVPATEGARLVNALVITPLRVVFLIVLVGTTLEVLAEGTRRQWDQRRWRNRMQDHIVVVGYGTKGSAAVETLLKHGVAAERIVVIDHQRQALARANAAGLVSVWGDATRSSVLAKAETARASTIVITTERDDTAVLCTLTARQLAPDAFIAASVREAENAPLVRQSGADTVVTSSEMTGNLLGASTLSPEVGAVVTDLLTYGQGLDIVEQQAGPEEIGRDPRSCALPVLGVIRGGRMLRFDDPSIGAVRAEDRVIVVRPRDPAAPAEA
ncbi:potassium channel family protein [Actinospica durhamensis]|uniref:potassium channel family protein n=1 Tax=Actinospica durhamensis TaxID=1508375 RepID=UPI0027DC357F|nr:potassium channel family protein [Actinospica durhamensis]